MACDEVAAPWGKDNGKKPPSKIKGGDIEYDGYGDDPNNCCL